MLLLIVIGKFLVWTAVVWLFRYPRWTAIAAGAGLTQIGELSFVVVQVARSSGIVGEDFLSTVIAASLISILLNVFIVRGAFQWLNLKVRSGEPRNIHRRLRLRLSPQRKTDMTGRFKMRRALALVLVFSFSFLLVRAQEKTSSRRTAPSEDLALLSFDDLVTLSSTAKPEGELASRLASF